MGLLFSPVLLFPWFASVALLALWLRHTTLWPNLLLLLLLPLCVITPWTIRNYKIFHHVLLIRNNLGFMLGSSNNDCATGWGWGDRSPACPGLENPYQDLKAAERFAREGEYQFNKEYLNAALAWIRQRPQRFLSLTLARIRYFWIPPLTYMESRLAVINSLAIAGLTLSIVSRALLHFCQTAACWNLPYRYHASLSGYLLCEPTGTALSLSHSLADCFCSGDYSE